MKKSTYVFGAAMAMGGVSSLMQQAQAASITAAAFTFETSSVALNATNITSPTYGPFVAESGLGTGSASHVATGTVYSSPGGNGSPRSLSSNNFAAGDYYQFSVPATGLQDLVVTFDQIASSTGPKVFNLAYTSDGVSFSNFTGYTLNVNASASSFAASSATAGPNLLARFSFDLSGITALNNDALASFRLVEADTTTATGGTSRVDNFVVAGNTFAGATSPSVPEPATLSLVAFSVGGLVARRRRA